MLVVLVGENRTFDEIEQSAGGKASIDWIVPKVAIVSDDVLLCLPERGFVARGIVATKPSPTMFGKAPAYRAEVGDIRLFRRPVSLESVAAAFPSWKWTTYPRSKATDRRSPSYRRDCAGDPNHCAGT
jgi:hypothetical protein